LVIEVSLYYDAGQKNIIFWTRLHFSSLLAKFTRGSRWELRRAAVYIPLVYTVMLSFHLMTRSVSQPVGCARRMSLKRPERYRLQSKGQFLRPFLPRKNNNNTQFWNIKHTAWNTALTHFILSERNTRGFYIFTLLDRWDISFCGNKYISWQMRFLQSRRSFEESTHIMNSIKKTVMKLKGERFIPRHLMFYFDVLAAWKSSGFTELYNFRCLFISK